MARPDGPRISRTGADIQEMFLDQLDHLRASCNRFDEGDTREYRRIATTLRVLFHNTATSHSLVKQAGMSDRSYVNSGRVLDPANKISECNLVGLVIRAGWDTAYWRAGYDDGLLEFVTLDKWWSQPILSDQIHLPISRARIVCVISNQDGGAHVDPAFDEALHKIRTDSFALTNGKNVALHIDRHIIRQIGHEVIKTFDPVYSKQSDPQKPLALVRSIVFKEANFPDPPLINPYHLTSPDMLCPCRSGASFANCHKQGAVEPIIEAGKKRTMQAPPNAAFAQVVVRYEP